MGSEEIARMYEYYDSVLHAVREGLVLLDERGRVQLVNDEAGRLLDLPEDRQLLIGRPVDVLALPGPLTDRLRGRSLEDDEIHLVGDRVLVVNQAAARWEGRDVGSVVTFRDHTELQAVTGELDTVRGMTDSLRALNHESANRLHTVVSLIELDRIEEAVTFATDELETVQRLTDRLVAAVDEPVVAALLLGKSATAAERGIDLVVDPESRVSGLPVEGRDLVTLLGNLLDNALDAVGRQVAPAERRIRVRVVASRSALEIAVDDSGPGVSPADVARVFERGWSTKTPGHGSAGDGSDGESGGVGRGLGLALVGQTARRYGGGVEVAVSDLGGARFVVRVPEPAPAAAPAAPDAPGAPA
jgi:sensor histidine kinase regulating citrate/malate metabolism